MNPFRLLLLVSVAFIGTCAGTKPPPSSSADDLQNIVDTYFQATDSIAKAHPLRLGVLPFAASGTQTVESGNEFGSYIAEKLISRMAGAGERIKVFERSRLDAIFKENSIELSGIVKNTDAIKVGELAPIDYLFTGTYTLLKHRISLSGRLIDVASGEIVFASSDECGVTDELAGLFPDATDAAPALNGTMPQAGDADRCAGLQSSLENKVNAAKPDDQFTTLIDEGIKIPFDTTCQEIHFTIMRRCRRDAVNPPKYTDFLLSVLTSTDRPDEDNRTDAIFNYFRADDVIDDKEWRAGCDALTNIHWVDRYLGKLIIGDTLSAILEQRLADFASRCRQGTIGKPPVSFDDQLYHVLLGLGMFGRSSAGMRRWTEKETRQVRDVLYLMKKFSPDITWSVPEKYADLLQDLWRHERYSPLADSLFSQMCDMITRAKPDKGAALIQHTAGTLIDDMFDRDTASAAFHRNAVGTTQVFAGKCRQQIIDATAEIDSRQLANTDIPALCLFTGIAAPAIPTVDSLSVWLSSEDAAISQRAVRYVVYMQKRAIVLENKLIRVLRQRIRGDNDNEHQNGLLVRAIGATQTGKPEACELLALCLDSLNYRFPPSEVVRAMAGIGRPAIPYMKRYFEKDPVSHVYSTADYFEQLGSEAKAELPYLERRAGSIDDKKARYYLEDAIERIKVQQ